MATVASVPLPQAVPVNFTHDHVTLKVNTSLLTGLARLRPSLSDKATIVLPGDEAFENSVQRFSDYKKPTPGAVVRVASEQDIAATIKWAVTSGTKFLARSGAHGWAMSLSAIGPEGVLIDLRAMDGVSIDQANGTATIGAGASTGQVLKAAQDAGCHIVTPACNSVGAVASIMGGGVGNLVSNFGLGSDNIVSARVVTSDGSVVTASPAQNPDLFWGLRGAGPNFGIHWAGMLGFPGSQETAERVLETVENMGITEGNGPIGSSCSVVYGRPAPSFEPTVLLKLSFNGSASAAKSAFAPLYDIAATTPPSINTSEMLPASDINDYKDSICEKGGMLARGNKPVQSASFGALDVATMGALYQRWEQFTESHDEAKESIIHVNCYDYRQVRTVAASESAFAWRQNPINVLQSWSYTDDGLNDEVERLGQEFRQALTGDKDASVMMNFASGDEKPEAVYGQNLERLRALKEKWDPTGAFSFYNPV